MNVTENCIFDETTDQSGAHRVTTRDKLSACDSLKSSLSTFNLYNIIRTMSKEDLGNKVYVNVKIITGPKSQKTYSARAHKNFDPLCTRQA